MRRKALLLALHAAVLLLACGPGVRAVSKAEEEEESKAGGPKEEVSRILSHVRENGEEAQGDANKAYLEGRSECERLVEEVMGEVRPVQRELLSSASLLRERRRQIQANKEAAGELAQAEDVLAGRVETLGLRMAEAAKDRREAHHLAAAKLEDTTRLIASVRAAMASLSNAHARLSPPKEEKEGETQKPASFLQIEAEEPTPVRAPAAAAAAAAAAMPSEKEIRDALELSPTRSVESSFKLLNLLRHELSEYAVALPKQQSEAQLSFERVYSHLNESYSKARVQHREAVRERKRLLEENEYLAEWVQRTRVHMPEMRRRLRTLQTELREAIAECEEARVAFKLASSDRKRELETLATVERIVDKELTDADFLPVPKMAPKGNATELVVEKADPDLDAKLNNTDAKSEEKPKEKLEDNIIYG